MYERHKLCETLTPSDVCFVVEKYSEGDFLRKFHKHIPKRRLSKESCRNLLQALVLHFSAMSPESIVRCCVNNRPGDPVAAPLTWHVTYPEPGVIRKYCGANTKAWSDQVVHEPDFRRDG